MENLGTMGDTKITLPALAKRCRVDGGKFTAKACAEYFQIPLELWEMTQLHERATAMGVYDES